MQVHIEVTQTEPAEMDCDVEDLRQSVENELNSGIELTSGEGRIYLSRVSVGITVKP